jgi:putative endonuclease
MYWIYVLESETTEKRYIGQTSSLITRLEKHNSGGNISTKNGIPWRLIASKAVETRAQAMIFERKLKNLKSHIKQNHFLLKNNFDMQGGIGPEK